MMNIDRELACEHYSHVKDKPFFNDMIDYITSGPVVVMVLSGYRVIEAVRSMVGATSNFDSKPGTIRGDYGYHRFENLIHASDSCEKCRNRNKEVFPRTGFVDRYTKLNTQVTDSYLQSIQDSRFLSFKNTNGEMANGYGLRRL